MNQDQLTEKISLFKKNRNENPVVLQNENFIVLKLYNVHRRECSKKRLEKDPNGFFLDSTEGPLNCGVCGDSTPGNRIWWDLNGIRCADCQRNIEERVISKNIIKDEKLWIKEFHLKYDYSLHPTTIRKLKKEGLLHGKDLKRQDGTTYCTIYLVADNKEFFKKYPKKPKIKIEWKMKDEKGNEVIL